LDSLTMIVKKRLWLERCSINIKMMPFRLNLRKLCPLPMQGYLEQWAKQHGLQIVPR